jgi:hypothetical protein
MKRTVPHSNGDVTNRHDPNGNLEDEEESRKRLRAARSAVSVDVQRLIIANSNDDINIGFDERREGYRFLQQLQQQQDQQGVVAAAVTAASMTRQDNFLQNISATISSALSSDASSNELLRSRASSVAQAFHPDNRRDVALLGDGALALYRQQQNDHAALEELMHRYGSTGGGVTGGNTLDSTIQQQPMLPPDPNHHNLSYSLSRSITGTKVITTLHRNKCLCKRLLIQQISHISIVCHRHTRTRSFCWNRCSPSSTNGRECVIFNEQPPIASVFGGITSQPIQR